MTLYLTGNVISGTIFGHLQVVSGSIELEVQAPLYAEQISTHGAVA